MTTTLTCLSVRQPWAWLIVAGYKDIENRTWDTKYRGETGIHASGKFDWSFFELLDDIAETDPIQEYGPIVRKHFGIAKGTKKITKALDEFGALLGTANLTETMPTDEDCGEKISIWAFDNGFAWRFEDGKEFKKPIPVNGKLNLWKFEMKGKQQ